MNESISIKDIAIGPEQPVFIVAEVGINHDGDFEAAKDLIKNAKDAGASAVKMQTYITEKRVPRNSPIFDILKRCELSFEQQKELFEFAEENQMIIFSTPFDDESVDFLASVDIPCYKIASFDLVNKKLLKKVAERNRPIIMSRGMANQKEIDLAVDIIKQAGTEYALLHCISAYPVADIQSLNLSTIGALAERYHCPVGFSDHTLDIDAAKYAVAVGATIIEKHFTYSRSAEGPDHAISTEPAEMKTLVDETKRIKEMLGQPVWRAVEAEADILQYRRES